MASYFILLFLISGAKSLKTWIPNTCINNTLNWDKQDFPKDCDNLIFPFKSDVETIWDIRNIAISGLSLPGTGDLIFPDKINIVFKSKNNCLQARDLKYTRTEVKGWLDPNNWLAENETEWLPHTEKVPCSGETIRFPSGSTFAIQLPSILLPVGDIHLDDLIFDAYKWKYFLNSEMGFGFFKGPSDLRNKLWHENSKCFYNKKCKCVRSPYTIRNGIYKSISANIYKEAVCLYAKPKCKPVNCYSPVIPDGHCCGICGAVLKIENSKEGIDLEEIKAKIKNELHQNELDDQLKIYVGYTIDGNIQVVVIPKNSNAATETHYFASVITKTLLGKKSLGRIMTTHISGLSLKQYLFNSISGIIFGTFFAVILFFGSLFYFYIILPKKKLFKNKPFTFARFDNTANEESYENLDIGVEAGPSQAFDNPMYAADRDTSKKFETTEENLEKQVKDDKDTQEYSNPIYSSVEEPETSEKFETFKEEEKKKLTEDILEFSEIEL